jgi:hypothetical protein
MPDKQTAATQAGSESGEIPKPAPFDPWRAQRGDFAARSLDELADYAASTREGTMMSGNVYSEIKRREMVGQFQILEATLKAAKASEDAALQSRRSATWMMWSVIVAAASAVVAAVSVVLPLFGVGR